LLEHVYDPRAVVLEVHRILNPCGRLLITVPFLVQVHGDPDDYGRYTDSFWKRLLSNSGFADVEVQSQGQFWAVVLDLVRAWLLQMRQQHPRRRVAMKVASWFVARARRRVMVPEPLVAGMSATGKQFTTGFGIRARKRLS
jgi:SAM-dependent methyltransferase